MWTYNNDELYHFGIPGMKWGIRRYQNADGSLTEKGKKHFNSKYSSEQIRRDRRVYGNSGVNRINKRMNNGESISGARSGEASRIDHHRQLARTGRTVGALAGSVGGMVVGMKLVQKLGKTSYSDLVNNPAVSLAIIGATSSIGKQLGQYGGQSAGMLTGGYSPDKFRY